MLDAYPMKTQSPEMVVTFVRLLGTGAADPTKERGVGVTATRVALGQYRLTFAENLGTFLGANIQFAKNAPAAGSTKITTVDHDSYTVTGRALDLFVEDPGSEVTAPALADLTSDERVYVLVGFERIVGNK